MAATKKIKAEAINYPSSTEINEFVKAARGERCYVRQANRDGRQVFQGGVDDRGRTIAEVDDKKNDRREWIGGIVEIYRYI